MQSQRKNDGQAEQLPGISSRDISKNPKLASQPLADLIEAEEGFVEYLKSEIAVTSSRMKMAQDYVNYLCADLADTQRMLDALKKKQSADTNRA